jgi:hypothetical protein
VLRDGSVRPVWYSGCMTSCNTPRPASHHRATIAAPEPVITIPVAMYALQSTSAQVVMHQWRKLVICNHLFPGG